MEDFRHVVRKWVKPSDLNQHGALFGGRLMEWVDEEAAIVAALQIGTVSVVTRHMSAVDFVGRAERGDLLELTYGVSKFGRSSVTLSCNVDNVATGQMILTLEEIVFVAVNEHGQPFIHGFTTVANNSVRLRPSGQPSGRPSGQPSVQPSAQ
jgi:acyl-CoA hydrolase